MFEMDPTLPTYSFIKTSELQVNDIVHRGTELYRVHQIDSHPDGHLFVWLDWLEEPSGDDGGFEIVVSQPINKWLKQTKHDEVPAPVDN